MLYSSLDKQIDWRIMKEIKYGKTTVLATAVLLRTVRENLSQLEEMNWEKGKPENHNLLTSHEDFFKLTQLSDSLLDLIGIDSNFVDEITRDGGDISVSIYDHSGDDTGLSPQLFTTGIYRDSELTSDWLGWYRDTQESKKEEE
tara:strand:- start:568 stop:999 length:432 start_codon:yes stop_codon:yes gene_type:complete